MKIWFENWTKLSMRIELLLLDWVNLPFKKIFTIKLKSWENYLRCQTWLMSKEKTPFWCSRWLKLDQNRRRFENKFYKSIMEEDILIQKVTKILNLLRMGTSFIHEYWLIESFINEQECFNPRTINGERKAKILKDLNSKWETAKNFKRQDIESLLLIWCSMQRTF